MNRFIKLFAFVPVIGLFYLFLSGTAYAFDDPLTVNSLSIQRDQYNNEVMSFDISGIEDYFFTDTYNTVYILSTNSDGNPTSDFYVQAYNLNLNNCDQPESGEVICNDINITSSGGTVQPDYVRFVLSDQYSSNRQDGLYYFVGPPTPTVPVTPGLTPGLTVTPTPTYTLSGTAYTDANKNGVQDSGETGFSGATVTLEET